MSENPGVGAPTPINTPGPDHRAEPVTTAPNKAFWRTAVQVGPAAFVSLVLVLPLVIQEIVDGFGRQLPDGLRVWLLGAAVFLTTAASVTARIMANPAVLAWTRRYAPFFSPTQK